MKLAIIGSGNIGKSIGGWAAKVGYEVIFSAKEEANARAAAKRSGYDSKASSVRVAVEASDMVLLAVPYSLVKGVLDDVRPLLRGKTLIDVTNPLSENFSALTIGHNNSAAEEIARLVPETAVVKAFNTCFAQVYAAQSPKVNGHKISIFYAGDDKEAKGHVGSLITKLGFDAVDAGPLTNARLLEPLAMLNISLGYSLGYGTAIGFTLVR